MLNKFLSEKEDIEVRRAVQNKNLMQGLKKVFFSQVYNQGEVRDDVDMGDPSGNFALNKAFLAIQQDPHITNQELGENLRADAQALRQMELAFKSLETFKPQDKPVDEKSNPAR